MTLKSFVLAGAGVMMLAAPAFAGNTDPIVVYPYASSANYCPAGLQPVTTNGIICCGKPTANQSYQAAMRHPVTKVRKVRHVVKTIQRARIVCPVGEKGCYSQ